MFPQATDGALTNNKLFSSCSIDEIRRVLDTKADCFTRKFQPEGVMGGVDMAHAQQKRRHFVAMEFVKKVRNVTVAACVKVMSVVMKTVTLLQEVNAGMSDGVSVATAFFAVP